MNAARCARIALAALLCIPAGGSLSRRVGADRATTQRSIQAGTRQPP